MKNLFEPGDGGQDIRNYIQKKEGGDEDFLGILDVDGGTLPRNGGKDLDFIELGWTDEMHTSYLKVTAEMDRLNEIKRKSHKRYRELKQSCELADHLYSETKRQRLGLELGTGRKISPSKNELNLEQNLMLLERELNEVEGQYEKVCDEFLDIKEEMNKLSEQKNATEELILPGIEPKYTRN